MTDRPYIIRLRGPWQYKPLMQRLADGSARDAGELPPGGSTDLLSDWSSLLGPEFRGRVRYARRFGCPTNLSPQDQVQLVVARVDGRGTLFLNGELLACIPRGQQETRLEIGPRLQRRNLLQIDVEEFSHELPGTARDDQRHQPLGLTGEVWLEIYS